MPILLSQVKDFPIYIVGLILCISGLGGMFGTFTSKIIYFLGNVRTMLLGLII